MHTERGSSASRAQSGHRARYSCSCIVSQTTALSHEQMSARQQYPALFHCGTHENDHVSPSQFSCTVDEPSYHKPQGLAVGHTTTTTTEAQPRGAREIGPFCHQAKNVDLRKPPRPRRRAAAATRVALARCTAARPFSLTVQSAGSSSSSSSCTEAEAAGMGPLVVSALSCR